MKTSSAKAKGRKLQQHVRDRVLELYPTLTERDVVSAPMGVPGEDIQLSQVASELFPYSVECKNVEKLNIWKALEEAEGNNRDLEPIVVFKRNRSKTYCCLSFETFMELIKQNGTNTNNKNDTKDTQHINEN